VVSVKLNGSWTSQTACLGNHYPHPNRPYG